MGKIKLNLVSGGIVEKPLLSAFKTNDASYVVLDNEINGSMGLPIILVCKLDQDKVVKILDQNEWQVVKEYLKNIIAGQTVEYIKLPNELKADDIYYTQLTLPVPSFDALKGYYDPEQVNKVNNAPESTSMNMNTVEAPSNVESVSPIVNPVVDSQTVNIEPVNNPIDIAQPQDNSGRMNKSANNPINVVNDGVINPINVEPTTPSINEVAPNMVMASENSTPNDAVLDNVMSNPVPDPIPTVDLGIQPSPVNSNGIPNENPVVTPDVNLEAAPMNSSQPVTPEIPVNPDNGISLNPGIAEPSTPLDTSVMSSEVNQPSMVTPEVTPNNIELDTVTINPVMTDNINVNSIPNPSNDIIQPTVEVANVTANPSVQISENPIMANEMVTPSEPINNNVLNNTVLTSEISNPNIQNNGNEAMNSNNIDLFKDQKEAFMQACENMFDALVQKFTKELEKNGKTE